MKTLVSGNAPALYPIELLFGLLNCENGNIIEIPIQYPTRGEWGKSALHIYEEPQETNKIISIDLVYLSIIEKKFYSLESDITSLPTKGIIEQEAKGFEQKDVSNIVIGMAPYGLVTVWLETYKKSQLISHFYAKEIDVPMKTFRPSAINLTLEEVCEHYIEDFWAVKDNIVQHGFPSRYLFVEYIQQFTYRYLIQFEHWNNEEWQGYNNDKDKPKLDYVEEALFDGTHDKLHDGGLLNYHQAGKPKKLALKWHIKKSEYSAYFWFEDEEIRETFDRFYGAHPDTKTDFMIRIDSEKNKYELALYRDGLKEPQKISESVYQLLVFKNKFECYRSENYNQERGAWIW